MLRLLRIFSVALLVIASVAYAASTIDSLPQSTFPIPDSGNPTSSKYNLWMSQNGADVRATAEQAGYIFQGTTAPSSPFKYQFWWNTQPTVPQLEVYDGSQWLVVGALDAVSHVWTPPVGGGRGTLSTQATTDLGSIPETALTINGAGTITSFGSSAAIGTIKFLSFNNAVTLTNNLTSLILPGQRNILTTSGDQVAALYLGSGNWRVFLYQAIAPGGSVCTTSATSPPNPTEGQCWVNTTATPLPALEFYDGGAWLTVGSFDTVQHQWVPSVGGGSVSTITAGSTVDLGTVPNASIQIAGSTTITSFGSSASVGQLKFINFTGAPTIAYNATSMILPGGVSVQAQIGDTAIAQSLGAGNWRVLAYQRTSLSAPFVSNNAALKAASTAFFTNGVWRNSFTTAGDAAPLFYSPSVNPCTLSAGAGDDGSQVQSADGKCWLAVFPASGADAAQWGLSTSTVDSGPILQSISNWACTNNGRAYIAGGTYTFATQVTIGNGTSLTLSTQNNCAIIGVPAGASLVEMTPVNKPVVLKWQGALAATAIVVNGPMSGIAVEGIHVDCNLLCNTGFALHHPIGSDFKHLMVTNWRGQAFIHDAYQNVIAGLLTGSQHNKFSDLRSMYPVFGTGAGGITVGGDTYGLLDVAQNVYENSEFGFDSTNANGHGITLRFVDNVTFSQVATLPTGGGVLGYGLFINPPSGTTAFPGTVTFVNSAMVGGVNDPAFGWGGTVSFYPYPTGDGEPIPSSSNVYYLFNGFTDFGVPFGIQSADIIAGNSGAVRSFTSATTYIGTGGCNSGNGFGCSIPLPRKGHITSLTVGTSNPGGTITGTVYVNNVAQAMTCNIVSPATTCTDTNLAHLITTTSGQFVSLRVDGDAGAPGAAVVIWTIGFSY